MPLAPADPRWPKLLSLAVHEFRTPITVVSGYIRMVLKERAGAITDPQRKLLEEAEKSCGRLSALVAEMSDLSGLEAGTTPLNRSTVDLDTLLREAVAALPTLAERDVQVDVQPATSPVGVNGDATRLRAAIVSILTALRRELVTSDRLIVQMRRAAIDDVDSVVLAMGAPEQIEQIATADLGTLDRFDEWRGGSGLSLAIARRVVGQHGGSLLAPPGGEKAGALVVLPVLASAAP